MKPQLLKVTTEPAQSFSVRRDKIPFFNNKWHYHHELELIYLERGRGTQFVGDHMCNFMDGDLVLLGSNLPHYWRFDGQAGEGGLASDITVCHFTEHFLGEKFLALPEINSIRRLLTNSCRGIKVTGRTKKNVTTLLQQLLTTKGVKKIFLLLQILELIAESNDISYLSSVGFTPTLQSTEKDRINTIYEYSILHYRRKITLNEIADAASISPNSFCRYFKTHTGKTFSRFLLEYKIGIACKLLIDDKLSIQQICYECGFNNFASFYKSFKILTGRSPLSYQKNYLHKK